ncbi:MAG: hypothetical protein ABSG86_27910 [Thermoguttaceae bacterium]|jgi:hypothetical protein
MAKDPFCEASTAAPDRITVAAHRLAVRFTDEADLPARYRRKPSAKPRRVNDDAIVEKRFKANVRSWTGLIEAMLARIDNDQAWRFVGLSPQIQPAVRKLTDCKDFRDFVDYLILRRDKQECTSEELGGLSWLLSSFQRKIEERL